MWTWILINQNDDSWVTGVFFNAPREKNIESKISQSFVKANFSSMVCPYGFWAGNGVSRATPAVFIFHHPGPDYITEMMTSQWPVKECKIQSYAQQVRYLIREGFFILSLLLWHGTFVSVKECKIQSYVHQVRYFIRKGFLILSLLLWH